MPHFHELPLPPRVVLGECWARDGLQSEERLVPTDAKVEMIARMAEAGFTEIEATSFAHPKYLPQFADAEEVLRRIPRKAGVRYRAICTTMKAVERAVRSKEEGFGVDEIAMVISASEAHNRANVQMGHDENKRLLELIGFGDTVGVANPVQVSRFYEEALAAGMPKDRIVVHFHDTRGWGVANTLTALTFGFRYVDTSLGAIGGQPKTGSASYHLGHTGNTCTEDLVPMLEEMGIATGIDMRQLLAAGARAEELLGRRLRSNFLLAGPVPHRGREYDKSRGIVPPASPPATR